MPRKLLLLAVVLAVLAAACSEPPAPKVDLGSGVRFVPEVADPLSDAGMFTSVATTADGLPVVAYFGFEGQLAEGQVPPARPIGSPSLPGVMLATVSAQGYWTRGAIAIADQIVNVTVPFDPAYEPTVADLTPQNVTGLALVTAGDQYHAAWASASGVYYATGSLDPATTTQATASLVSNAPGLGLSMTVDDAGTPWIAFSTSTSSVGTLDLATPDGDRWQVDSIAEGGGCATCTTAVVSTPAGPAVVYSPGGTGIAVATNDGENGWTSFGVSDSGGQGLSAAPDGDAIQIASYDGTTVDLTTWTGGVATGATVSDVAEGSAEVPGARTSVVADGAGSVSVGWVDAATGVAVATGTGGTFQPVATGSVTADGAYPSLALAADPAIGYLGWYDTQTQDALVGGYGDIGEIAFAAPSPTSTAPIQPPAPPPSQGCTPVQNGTVTVVAEGIAFTDGSCIEVPVGEAFTIAFDNRDANTQHNIQVFGGAEPSSDLVFQGDLVTGPAQADYQIPAFDTAGDYAFNCVVHPTMIGKIHVTEGGGKGGGGGGGGKGSGGSALTVTAQNLAFDTSTIELTAGEPTTLTFSNQDSGVQHDIAIYEDDTLAVELFKGDLVTGVADVDYEIPALDAGEYYFLCIVHPTMNGTVVVS